MKIALIGHGAMGSLLESLVEKRGHGIAVVIDQDFADFNAIELATEIRGSDVAIDFSSAEAVTRNVDACMLAGVPLVEGTTGWNSEIDRVKAFVENSGGAMVFGANFSIGVNLMYRITEFAAELFARFSEYEVFIEEQHHSRKKDVPSGTALKLKQIVSEHISPEYSVSSTRAGNIPGTHRVGFDGAADQILLEHTARSREGFASGAITAAEWIAGKKGLFEFSVVMDEICQNRRL